MYSPRVKPEHIKPLYLLGKEKRRPMTHLVNEAITQYLEKEVGHGDKAKILH